MRAHHRQPADAAARVVKAVVVRVVVEEGAAAVVPYRHRHQLGRHSGPFCPRYPAWVRG